MEPKYTWEFDADSLLLRYYAAVWGLDPLRADFCKLFWSVVLSPLGVLGVLPMRVAIRCLTPPALGLANRVAKWIDSREPKPAAEKAAKAAKPKRVGPSWPERILAGVAHFFARPSVRLGARMVGWAAMAALALAILGGGGYAVVSWPIILLYVAGLAVGALALFAVIALLGKALTALDARLKRNRAGRTGPSRLRRFAQPIGEALVTAAAFLADGVHAVKSNTCPRIIVRGSQPPTSAKEGVA